MTPSPRDLRKVPHKKGMLFVSSPAFGPSTYDGNRSEMEKGYSHVSSQINLPQFSFRPATTSGSISAAAYDFENMAKPQIFDLKWLQAGYIVRTSEGVFANPPKDSQGNPIIDEATLKSFRDKSKKVNGIWLYEGRDARNFGFVPYDSFKRRGVQDCDSFTGGGLARVLEHTEDKVAKNLREIASPKFYKRGVNVWGFGDVKNPVLRIVSLHSAKYVGGGILSVSGNDWIGYSDGFAFGVCENDTEGVAPEK